MASSSDKRPPTAPGEGSLLRLRLRYPDVQTFVERFATNVTRGGVFLASKTPKPAGTLLRFELLLVDGKTRVLRGEGTVSWVREFDEANPNRPCGMGVKFNRLDPDSARLVERIEVYKRDRGIPSEIEPGTVTRPTTVPEPGQLAAPDEPTMLATPPSPPPPVSMPLAPAPPAPSPDDDDLLRLIEADGAALEERLSRALLLARALVEGDLDAQLAALEGDLPAPQPFRPSTTLPERPAAVPMPGGPREAWPSGGRSAAEPPQTTDDDDDSEPTTMAAIASLGLGVEEATTVVPRPVPREVAREYTGDTSPEVDVEDDLAAPPLPPPPAPPRLRPFAPEHELSGVSSAPAPVPVPLDVDDTGLEDDDSMADRTHVAAPPRAMPTPMPPADEEEEDVESVLDAALDLALADAAAAAAAAGAPPPAPAPAPPPPRPKEGGFFSKLFKK